MLNKNQLFLLIVNDWIDTKLKGREKDGLDWNREMRELKGSKEKSVITIQISWNKILCSYSFYAHRKQTSDTCLHSNFP